MYQSKDESIKCSCFGQYAFVFSHATQPVLTISYQKYVSLRQNIYMRREEGGTEGEEWDAKGEREGEGEGGQASDLLLLRRKMSELLNVKEKVKYV